MKSFDYSTAEDYQETCFGLRLLDIVRVLDLPIPTIRGRPMKKFNKEGMIAVRVHQPGRQSEPATEDIKFNLLHEDEERAVHIASQQLIGRFCGRHYSELKGHYSRAFGRRDEHGEAYGYEEGAREALRPDRQYFQDLEILVDQLDTDRLNEILSNDELHAQLKEKDAAIQEKEEQIQAMKRKFEEQDAKFKSQEKRVQEKNKKIRELKEELEINDFELEADRGLIASLRATKRELSVKVETLTKEVEEYKTAFTEAGLSFEEVEVEMEV